MVYSRVVEIKAVKVAICPVLIGKDRGANRNVIVDSLLNDWQTRVRNVHRFGSTAALTHTQNGLFTDRATTAIQFHIGVFVGLFAADSATNFVPRR